jgi:hypothetical protein
MSPQTQTKTRSNSRANSNSRSQTNYHSDDHSNNQAPPIDFHAAIVPILELPADASPIGLLADTRLTAILLRGNEIGLFNWMMRTPEASIRDLGAMSLALQRLVATRKNAIELAEIEEASRPSRETKMERRLTDIATVARCAAEEHLFDGVYREDGCYRRVHGPDGKLHVIRPPDAPPVPADHDPYRFRRALQDELQALIHWLNDSITTPGIEMNWDIFAPFPPPPSSPTDEKTPAAEDEPTDEVPPDSQNDHGPSGPGSESHHQNDELNHIPTASPSTSCDAEEDERDGTFDERIEAPEIDEALDDKNLNEPFAHQPNRGENLDDENDEYFDEDDRSDPDLSDWNLDAADLGDAESEDDDFHPGPD